MVDTSQAVDGRPRKKYRGGKESPEAQRARKRRYQESGRALECCRAYRRKLLERGLTTNGTPRKARSAQTRLAIQNAAQAWRWWIKNAPDKWLRTYYRALGKPWANPRLSAAKQWRIRYWLDEKFRSLEYERLQRVKASRRAVYASMKDGSLDGFAIQRMFSQTKTCFYCGQFTPRPRRTLDHFIPLSRDGTHSAKNVRVCCSTCNTRKGNKLPTPELLAELRCRA